MQSAEISRVKEVRAWHMMNKQDKAICKRGFQKWMDGFLHRIGWGREFDNEISMRKLSLEEGFNGFSVFQD
jgi:hypothetical protein